jgi:hypothetical protein
MMSAKCGAGLKFGLVSTPSSGNSTAVASSVLASLSDALFVLASLCLHRVQHNIKCDHSAVCQHAHLTNAAVSQAVYESPHCITVHKSLM